MGNSESHPEHSHMNEETERIKAAYARRQCGDLYSWFNPGQLFIIQERERRVLDLLKQLNLTHLEALSILEIGCGAGFWLGEFLKWGARPENLAGVELLPDKLSTARSVLPAQTRLVQANAAFLPFPAGKFDLVLQSMVFTSILDLDMKKLVAAEMLRVAKPEGLILWYDYHVNNFRNPDVRGVKKGEISRLFTGCQVELRRITLAPPLTRLLAPYSFLLCYFLSIIPFLNTHYLGIIRKHS